LSTRSERILIGFELLDKYLSTLGIAVICDFRLAEERRAAPTHWLGSDPPFTLNLTITAGQSQFMKLKGQLSGRTHREIIRGIREIYSQLPILAAEQFRGAFDQILGGSSATLIHCSVGKDRTGIFSALLLTALGVPRDIVFGDYLLSNKYLIGDNELDEARLNFARIGVAVDPMVLRSLLGVESEFLEATFEAIDRQYGSFESYWRGKLRFSDKDLQRLRSTLLTNSVRWASLTSDQTAAN
jgi:protein-tyrosine phosphatase